MGAESTTGADAQHNLAIRHRHYFHHISTRDTELIRNFAASPPGRQACPRKRGTEVIGPMRFNYGCRNNVSRYANQGHLRSPTERPNDAPTMPNRGGKWPFGTHECFLPVSLLAKSPGREIMSRRCERRAPRATMFASKSCFVKAAGEIARSNPQPCSILARQAGALPTVRAWQDSSRRFHALRLHKRSSAIQFACTA